MRSLSLSRLFTAVAVAVLAALSGADAAVGQAAPSQPGGGAGPLLSAAIRNARTVHARLAPPAPRNPPGLALYRSGLAELDSSRFSESLAPLQAAARMAPTNALYHGDLGAAYVGLERWDEAYDALFRARQLQSANPWFSVSLGAVRAMQERWAEAAANLEVAASQDSSIIDAYYATAAAQWFEWAGNRSASFEWSRLATQRYPDVAVHWLRLATIYRNQGDTASGLDAIRRYRALQPQDRSGQAIYAIYLYELNQSDSALAMATEAAQDSALRESAVGVMLGVGARALQARNVDLAARALTSGQALTAGSERRRFSFYLGHAQLQLIANLDQQAERDRACEPVRALDSLLTAAARNLEEGILLDSTRTANIISQTLPQYRARAAAMQQAYCRGRRD